MANPISASDCARHDPDRDGDVGRSPPPSRLLLLTHAQVPPRKPPIPGQQRPLRRSLRDSH
jgi:hypothetical protein